MMNVNMRMPEVSICEESRCAYNVKRSCHARAITIGDSITPMCDTFLDSSTHIINIKQMAGVGACKVSTCKHNEDFECQADNIQVGKQRDSVRCMTFET